LCAERLQGRRHNIPPAHVYPAGRDEDIRFCAPSHQRLKPLGRPGSFGTGSAPRQPRAGRRPTHSCCCRRLVRVGALRGPRKLAARGDERDARRAQYTNAREAHARGTPICSGVRRVRRGDHQLPAPDILLGGNVVLPLRQGFAMATTVSPSVGILLLDDAVVARRDGPARHNAAAVKGAQSQGRKSPASSSQTTRRDTGVRGRAKLSAYRSA
jgi:hypothetical protein